MKHHVYSRGGFRPLASAGADTNEDETGTSRLRLEPAPGPVRVMSSSGALASAHQRHTSAVPSQAVRPGCRDDGPFLDDAASSILDNGPRARGPARSTGIALGENLRRKYLTYHVG